MRASALLFALAALLGVAGIGWLAADRGISVLEQETRAQLSQALVAADQGWVDIRPDGLLVGLEGIAPDENARFRVLEIAGQLVDSRRIREAIEIKSTQDISTPEFSLQILRNDQEISLIGLIPLDHGRNIILPNLRKLGRGLQLTDMLETAEYKVPERWKTNVAFALEAAHKLTRTHINVTPDAISISGVTESVKTRDALSKELQSQVPDSVQFNLDLSAPLPLVNPFRFAAKLNGKNVDIAECSADSDASREAIAQTLVRLGANARQSQSCTLALGAPSVEWATVVGTTLSALEDWSGGQVDITDLEVQVTAPKGTPTEVFETVTAELQEKLPAAYHLTSILPISETTGGNKNEIPPPEFTLNLTEHGYAILKGVARDEPQRLAIATFAASVFGASSVVDELSLREDVPDNWTALVLNGLRNADLLHIGSMRITPSTLNIEGRTNEEGNGQLLSEKLAALNTENFEVTSNVTFDEGLVVLEGEIMPKTCAAELDAILSDTQISFDPSSAQIAETAEIVIESIAGILKSCPNASFEIGGHTDSQGSEPSNQALSQNRADAVLDALLERDVIIANFTAVGYGESLPIADNSTEEGREENRRIEFRLLDPSTSPTEPIQNEQN